jgi:hypothetical protein
VDPGLVGVEEVLPVPAVEELSQNYPNPFEETTYISYKLRRAAHVNLSVYDHLGRKVATLIDRNAQPGKYVEHFNASQHALAPGVYYFSLVSDHINLQRKMIIK